ncbi:MAG: hypothetical protein GX614_04820 [Sandaracinaceae bacterium]|nr:hypothetical protein [Sandaracinaceae bacterium]
MTAGKDASRNGRRLLGGRFEILEEIHEDAFSVFYAARDQKHGRRVDLRIFHAEQLGPGGASLLWETVREVAEGRPTGAVAIYGVGEAPGGASFIALEVLEGDTLEERLPEMHRGGSEGGVSLDFALVFLYRAAKILEAIGDAYVHGCLSPGALLISPDGELKILGFEERAILAAKGTEGFAASRYAYLASEVKAGEAPTRASDVFGLGAIFYAVLTGRSPAEGYRRPSETHPEADRSIDALMRRTIGKVENRFESPKLLRAALAQFLHRRGLRGDEDLNELLGRRLVERNSKRRTDPALAYLVRKDGIDHGPFNLQDIAKRIVAGLFTESDLLIESSGEARALGETKEFEGHFEKQRETLEIAQDLEAAEQLADKEDAARRRLFLGIGAGTALFLSVLIVFILTREGRAKEEPVEIVEAIELYELGEIRIEGSAELLQPPPRVSRPNARRVRGSRGERVPSYEVAMNEVIDLGDARSGGGGGQLKPAEVSRVLDARLQSGGLRCLNLERDHGRGLGSIPIDIAIGGDGKVIGVSARKGSRGFRDCLHELIGAARFPSFGSPRMAVRYQFRVD